MRGQFRAKTTAKVNPIHAFDNIWVYGDIIHSGNNTYIHPINNRVNMNGELGRTIIMHEIQPDTICRSLELDMREPFWENDIITDGSAVGVIRFGVFNSKYKGFYIDWQGSYSDLRNDVVYWLPMIKVIGNTIDNPDLLKVGGNP